MTTKRASGPARRVKRRTARRKVYAPGVEGRLRALEGLIESDRPRSAVELAGLRRQVADLESGHRRGLVWDEEAAARAVRLYGLLRHWKGEWAGQTFVLSPFQEHAIIAPLFGWRRAADGLRRFRTAYIEMPRKNGKTLLASGIGLQGLVADGEAGAEVVAAATKKEQAAICFTDAKRALGPQLKRVLEVHSNSIIFPSLGGTFKPLSSDHNSLDGLNIHRAIVDELHAHRTREVWDVLLTAIGARRQPLVVAITTAGDDERSICGEVRGLAKGVLEGRPDHDDSFFAFIACAELDDDWQDPSTWWKANPNLGVSLKREYLADLVRQARVSKAAENNFRRKHLNQWITGASEWIAATAWRACRVKHWPAPEELRERELFVGIDIGWRDDFAALGRVFPDRVALVADDREEWDEGRAIEVAGSAPAPQRPLAKVRRALVEVELWVPENGRRDIREAPLVNWIDKGLVHVTPGNTTDIDVIVAQVQADAQRYNLRQVALDPNNARALGNDLGGFGFDVFDFWQTIRNYHEPCLEFATLVKDRAISHRGHDVLDWMIGNVRLRQNSAGYVMPAKDKAPEKIDGPVALLMAMGLALFAPVGQRWFYEDHDVEAG